MFPLLERQPESLAPELRLRSFDECIGRFPRWKEITARVLEGVPILLDCGKHHIMVMTQRLRSVEERQAVLANARQHSVAIFAEARWRKAQYEPIARKCRAHELGVILQLGISSGFAKAIAWAALCKTTSSCTAARFDFRSCEAS
jgi:hypothetical protein